VQPVEPHPHIDAQQIAWLEDPLGRRDTVDDLLVDRGAQRGGEVVQALERGLGARVGADESLSDPIELFGRDPRPHRARHERERFSDDPAGGRHRFDLAWRLDRDHRPMTR
jgi:hypothetical protein